MALPGPPHGFEPTTPLNPNRAWLLDYAKLQKYFERGEDCWLFDDQGRRYLDLLAQYGAIPFGHSPTSLWEIVRRTELSATPLMVQPSMTRTSEMLASRLLKLAPGSMKYATFCCTGAEAVEAAIKMARAKTGKPGIIAIEGAFHGKTLGALSATGRSIYQTPFFAPIPDFHHVPFGDLEALQALLETHFASIGLFIVELVQGEGGMRCLPGVYLQAARDLCRRYGVLFAVDEVQTGLGRLGALFACSRLNLDPDIITLAKALGGGIVPVGACLAAASAWSDAFGLLHSSTFANHTLGCAVALGVLDLLTTSNLLERVVENGRLLCLGLEELVSDYPELFHSVTGDGLMLGLHINASTFTGDDSLVMASVANEGTLAYLLCGHLVNCEHLWVAPLLNEEGIIRIEPPLIINQDQIAMTLKSFRSMAKLLSRRDFKNLLRYYVDIDAPAMPGEKTFQPHNAPQPPSPIEPGENRRRFAFFVHYPSLDELRLSEPSFGECSDSELRIWLKALRPYARPRLVYHLPKIRSHAGATAEGFLIALPLIPEHFMFQGSERIQEWMEITVQIAKDLDVDMLGLGAFTSVMSDGGERVVGRGVPVTTGNSYTAIMAHEGLTFACRQLGYRPENLRILVVGAYGSVGRVSAVLAADIFSRLYLVGNPNNPKHLIQLSQVGGLLYRRALHSSSRKGLANRLRLDIGDLLDGPTSGLADRQHQQRIHEALRSPGSEADEALFHAITHAYQLRSIASLPILIGSDANAAAAISDVIVSATSAGASVLSASSFKPGAVVCDVALPPDVAAAAKKSRPDVLVFDGGLARFPDPGVAMGFNFGYPPGLGLGCLTETMILALEGDRQDFSIGKQIRLEDVEEVQRRATRHGFSLGGLRFNGEEVQPSTLERVRSLLRSPLRNLPLNAPSNRV